MSTMDEVLNVLLDAPMRLDGLVHELGSTERATKGLLTRLVNVGAARQDDTGLWHAVPKPAEPPRVPASPFAGLLPPIPAAQAAETTATDATPAEPVPEAVKPARKVRAPRPAAPPAATPPQAAGMPLHLVDIIASSTDAERILAVLLLSGRLRRCDVERAAALVGADA